METLPLTVAEAVLGCRVVDAATEGAELDLRIPPETEDGRLFRASAVGAASGGRPEGSLLKTKIVARAAVERGETIRGSGEIRTVDVGRDGIRPRGVIAVPAPEGATAWTADAAAALLDVWGRARRPALLLNLHPGAPTLDRLHGAGSAPGIAEVVRTGRSLAEVAIRAASGAYAYLPLGAVESPEDIERLLSSDPVRRLVGGVRAANGVLLVVLPAGVGRAATESGLLDGFLAVGDSSPPHWSDLPEIARLPAPGSAGVGRDEPSDSASGSRSTPTGTPTGRSARRTGRGGRIGSLFIHLEKAGQVLVVLLIVFALIMGTYWLFETLEQDLNSSVSLRSARPVPSGLVTTRGGMEPAHGVHARTERTPSVDVQPTSSTIFPMLRFASMRA